MITEDFVSFETAKLLKEKGFDVWGDGSFGVATKIWKEYSPSGILNDCSMCSPSRKAFPAPTLQMTMKWLREVHNLEIYPYHNYDNSKWWVEIIKYPNSVSEYESGKDEEFDTYEEACEAAIKYCLENLI